MVAGRGTASRPARGHQGPHGPRTLWCRALGPPSFALPTGPESIVNEGAPGWATGGAAPTAGDVRQDREVGGRGAPTSRPQLNERAERREHRLWWQRTRSCKTKRICARYACKMQRTKHFSENWCIEEISSNKRRNLSRFSERS